MSVGKLVYGYGIRESENRNMATGVKRERQLYSLSYLTPIEFIEEQHIRPEIAYAHLPENSILIESILLMKIILY